MIPKMFASNHEVVLEKVCNLLKKLKIKDSDFKLELILEMQCIILEPLRLVEVGDS